MTKFVSIPLNDFKNQFIDNITNGKFNQNRPLCEAKNASKCFNFFNIFQYKNWFKFYKNKNKDLKY